MHYAQIEERATFECFITFSLCPTGLGEITQGYCEVFTHVCLIEWQNFTVRKPTQQKFRWNVNSYYRTWLLIYKVYYKYISWIENIVKISWVTFSYNQVWRHHLRHVIVRNVSINTVLTSPSPQLNCRMNVSYSGHSYKTMANCVKCRFSLNLQSFSVVLKSVPVKYIATYCPWDSHQKRSSCTSMSLWWQNNPSFWLSWTVSIPK